MHVYIVTEFDDLQKIRKNWDEVYTADPDANYFLSWHWVAKWLEDRTQWLVLAAKADADGDDYVAFFPLQLQTHFEKGIGLVNSVRTAGTPFAVYSGILSLPDCSLAAMGAFSLSLQQLNWQRLILDDIYMSPQRLNAFLEGFADQQFSFSKISRREHITDKGESIDHDVYVYVRLPANFERFLMENLGPKTRRDARRVLRDLEKEFRVTQTSAATIERDLDIFYGMWAAQWKEKQPQEAAYTLDNCRRMLARCLADGTLLVPILWHGEKPVAAQIIFIDEARRTLVCFLTGRDLALKRPAPGFLLHCYNLRWAIENGFEIYDLGTGDFSYKFTFGSDQHVVEKLVVKTRSGRNIGDRIDPRSLGTASRTAAQLARNGELVDAAICCNQILDADPDDMVALKISAWIDAEQHANLNRNLATLFRTTVASHRSGDLVAAEAGYRRLIAIDPGSFDAAHQLALLFLQTGRLEAAEEFIRQATEKQPKVHAAQLTYGNILAALNRYEAALERYDQAIALDNNHAVAFNNRGATLCRLGRNAEAVASFARALELDENHWQARENLAAIKAKLDAQSHSVLAEA